MTERLDFTPEPQEWWQTAEAAVAKAREAVGEQYTLSTITVAHDQDDFATGSVWLKGSCDQHEGVLMMRATYDGHKRQLALAVARQVCAPRGHEQNYDDLLRQSAEDFGIREEE
jgi:hypothetical protein